MTKPRAFPTWLPNTPMAQALETYVEGNQVAASSAGIPKTKIWAIAHIVWPINSTGKHQSDRCVAITLIQLPRQLPNAPRMIDLRSPFFWRNHVAGNINGM